MSISCAVVKDLLPLYQEGMLSEESKAAVEEHLETCEPCRAALKHMRAPDSAPPAQGAPLRQVSAKLRRSISRLAGFMAAVVLLLATVTIYHMTKQQYVPYSPDLVRVEKVADGQIEVQANGITGVWSQVDVPEQADMATRKMDGTTVYLSFFRTGITPPEASSTFTTTFDEVGVLRVYYAYPGETAVLLYGPTTEEGVMLLPRLALNMYLMAAVAVLLISGLLWLAMRHMPRGKRVGIITVVAAAYIQAHLMIKGLDGSSWDMGRDMAFILTATVFGALAMLLSPGNVPGPGTLLNNDRTL